MNNFKITPTESPNIWIATSDSFYFIIESRIKSSCESDFEYIMSSLLKMVYISDPDEYLIMPRKLFIDSKNANYTWSLDILSDIGKEINNEKVKMHVLKSLEDEAVFVKKAYYSGGSYCHIRLRFKNVQMSSDHYHKNHYDFYDKKVKSVGGFR